MLFGADLLTRFITSYRPGGLYANEVAAAESRATASLLASAYVSLLLMCRHLMHLQHKEKEEKDRPLAI